MQCPEQKQCPRLAVSQHLRYNLVNTLMLLREFVYFTDTDAEQQDNQRYDPSDDASVLSVKDTRKTRLTLKMLNKLRLAGEAREQETMEDLALVRKMYAQPAPEAALA